MAAWGADPVPQETESDAAAHPTSVWMKKKLEYSQAILRGLALGDFELIGTNAAQMRLLNKVEGFVRRRNPQYRQQVRVFEDVCDELVEQANEENLAGVTLAFHQLTVNCVRCHQALRAAEEIPDPNP